MKLIHPNVIFKLAKWGNIMVDSLDNENHSTGPILVVKNLQIGYDKPIVEEINLVVNPGEIISIVGESGIGKTTLLRTIAGLVKPFSGTIECDVPRRGGLGYIPQKLGLIRHTSVEHNVDLGARAGVRLFPEPFSWFSRRKERVFSAIEEMSLSDKTYEPVRRLSGGQQRRVATARTLAQRPKLILADEFLSELDDGNIAIVVGAVKNYLSKNDAAMIIVEHNTSRAKEISNSMFKIVDKKLVPYEAPKDEVIG